MPSEDEILQVMVHNKRLSQRLESSMERTGQAASAALKEADLLLEEFADLIDEAQAWPASPAVSDAPLAVTPWMELVAQAREDMGESVSYRDLLSITEMREVVAYQEAFRREWAESTTLDAQDRMVAALSGVAAAIVDLVYVGEPSAAVGAKVATLLGAPSDHSPSSPAATFDKTLGCEFGAKGNHRWNSVSHHPSVGGLIAALRDVLSGTSTHVVEGRVVTVQNMTAKASETMKKTLQGDLLYALEGLPLLQRVLAAVQIVIRHWWSDWNTSIGLPVPWMLLGKFLHVGRISINGEELTIAELAHELYKGGLDLRRFLADGLVVCINEVLVRLWLMLRRLSAGDPLRKALSAALRPSPRQRRALLCAHAVTAACNAGKVWITSNPLSINLTQWTVFLGYLTRHLQWLLFEQDKAETSAHIQRWVDDMRASVADLGRLEASLRDMPAVRLSG